VTLEGLVRRRWLYWWHSNSVMCSTGIQWRWPGLTLWWEAIEEAEYCSILGCCSLFGDCYCNYCCDTDGTLFWRVMHLVISVLILVIWWYTIVPALFYWWCRYIWWWWYIILMILMMIHYYWSDVCDWFCWWWSIEAIDTDRWHWPAIDPSTMMMTWRLKFRLTWNLCGILGWWQWYSD